MFSSLSGGFARTIPRGAGMPHRQVSGAVAIHNLRHQNSPVRSPGHLPVLFHKQKIPGTIAIPGILVAAGEGFEPSHTESESAVLPLHNTAIFCRPVRTAVFIITGFSEKSTPIFHFFQKPEKPAQTGTFSMAPGARGCPGPPGMPSAREWKSPGSGTSWPPAPHPPYPE